MGQSTPPRQAHCCRKTKPTTTMILSAFTRRCFIKLPPTCATPQNFRHMSSDACIRRLNSKISRPRPTSRLQLYSKPVIHSKPEDTQQNSYLRYTTSKSAVLLPVSTRLPVYHYQPCRGAQWPAVLYAKPSSIRLVNLRNPRYLVCVFHFRNLHLVNFFLVHYDV